MLSEKRRTFICRNPLIQKMFVFIGVGEKGGSGAGIIAKGWKDNGWKQLPSLREVTHPDRVEMTLFIPTFTGDKTIEKPATAPKTGDKAIEKPATTPKTGDKIGDIMKKTIFDYIVSHPNCKSTDIASCVGLQISQTKWYLNQLTEEGKILPLGANRNRTYCAK